MQTDVTTISPTVSPAILSTVSRDWQLWIAENLLRDCTPESMVGTMVAAGVDPMAAVDAIQEAATSPTLEAARRHQQITRKLESIMLNQNKLERLSPSYSTVERRKGLTTKQLFEDYYLQCRPVVVTDMMDSWQQVKQWSPQYLKQHFGDTEVEVQYGRGNDKNYEQNKLKYRRKILLGEFVDAVLGAGPSNNLYLTANNEALKNSALSRLIGEIGALPEYLDPTRAALDTFLWFGPEGTVTPLHHDTVCLFHLQVVGRKRWRFISPMQTPLVYNYNQVFSQVDLEDPDLSRYPLFAQATIVDVVVEPGEAIFLPLAWWHHVRSLDTCISVSFGNVRLPGGFEYQNPNNGHW
jgi:Cupin-like domain